MSSYDVPLYDGKSGTPFMNLKAGVRVYTTGDTLESNQGKLVKIVWGDSTAYAPINWLLPQGRLVVVTGKNKFEGIPVYSDPIMANEVALLPEWLMIVVGREEFPATTVLYNDENSGPKTGYIDSSIISTDPLDIEFFRKYIEAERLLSETSSSQLMADLKADARYRSLRAWAYRFGEDNTNVVDERGDAETGEDFNAGSNGNSDYSSYDDFIASSSWVFMDGDTPTTESESPGTYKMYFVFADGTEIPGEGLSLTNYYPNGPNAPDELQNVRQVRFEFVAGVDCDAKFRIETWNDGNPVIFREELINPAEASKAYSVIVEGDNDHQVLCGAIRATLWAADKKAVKVVECECGD
jgi:hypothetical protein